MALFLIHHQHLQCLWGVGLALLCPKSSHRQVRLKLPGLGDGQGYLLGCESVLHPAASNRKARVGRISAYAVHAVSGETCRALNCRAISFVLAQRYEPLWFVLSHP